jgi:hypothetical protein
VGIACQALTGGNALGSEMATVIWGTAGIVALVALASGVAANQAAVAVRLDASRRWVTLGNVHNDFAHAVETSRSDHHPAAP